jgi:putative ABC transport system ATP-binding protein
LIEIDQVRFRYRDSPFELDVPNLFVPPRQKLAIIGPSGSGKTTLLHLMAGIRRPEAGCVRMGSTEISRLSDSAARTFRIANVGLVFQEFELLDYLNVQENILLPYRLGSTLPLTPEARIRAKDLAHSLGLSDKITRPVRALSQGERQRVAIARALVTEPSFVLADEPTGNLDPTRKGQVLDLFLAMLESRSATLVMVTHDHSLLDRFDRVLSIEEIVGQSSTNMKERS